MNLPRGQCRKVQALRSNHKEADTRMILHDYYAAQSDRRLVIQSPDTDVFNLSINHFRSLDCPELCFRTAVKDRHRLILVHDIVHILGVKTFNLQMVSVVAMTTEIVCLFSEKIKS